MVGFFITAANAGIQNKIVDNSSFMIISHIFIHKMYAGMYVRRYTPVRKLIKTSLCDLEL